MVHEVPYNPWQDIVMHRYEPPPVELHYEPQPMEVDHQQHVVQAAHPPHYRVEQPPDDVITCVEIHGPPRQQVCVQRKSLPDMNFDLTDDIMFQIQQQSFLPKILLADLLNEQLVQVLQVLLNSQVQTLDIANCAMTTDALILQLDATTTFPALTQINLYSCHFVRDDVICTLLQRAPLLQHLSLSLVKCALDGMFANVSLPRLSSIDFKGCFTSDRPWSSSSLLPQLQHVTIVATIGSRLPLGHAVTQHLMELVLGGKTIAGREDIQLLAQLLQSPTCRLRKLHLLLGEPLEEEESLLQAIQHNTSLLDVVIGPGDKGGASGDLLNQVMMRNQYLTHGLGKLVDVRLLPSYLENVQRRQQERHAPLQAIHFMVRQRPDLFCRQRNY